MFDFIHRCIMAGYTVSIDFTKHGWRQFAKLNTYLGIRYIRAFILKRDVAEYIAAHEAAGVKLDTECQEMRYSLRKRPRPLRLGTFGLGSDGAAICRSSGCLPAGVA